MKRVFACCVRAAVSHGSERGPSTHHNDIKGESVKRMIKDWAVALSLGMLVFLGIQWLQPKPTIPEIAPDFTVKTID